MKNIYPMIRKTGFNTAIFIALVLLFSQSAFSQVIVDFAPRTSQYTPNKTIYNIKGDFQLLGNTNMTLETYTDEGSNGNVNMIYVDIDGVDTTLNSSSAELVLSPVVDNPECANIIYAGLYWTARAHDPDESPNTFDVIRYFEGNDPETIDHDQAVYDDDDIDYTFYTLPIVRTGTFLNRVITYTFTPGGTGNTVAFIYAHNSGSQTLQVSVNGGTATTVPTSSIDANDAYLTTPYTIYTESGGITLTVDHFYRNGSNSSEGDCYADINVSGTYYPPVPFTKHYDKSAVYFKHENASDYTRVSASDANFTQNILYPSDEYGNMYSAYAEVTDYIQTYGVGDYTVADIAATEGNGSGTGFYAGWALIVVYESEVMDRRDVIIFDGHAYVVGSTTISHELPVSGFQATQAGPVNMKLGMVAGEGDRGITGDYFEIRDTSNTFWEPLSHGANSTSNFFNSSIYTGGNSRNPDTLNNTGMDVSMFDIPNTNNYLITNNQDSTTFRYGSTQDTYIIFCIAMAVDAYRPEPEGLNVVSTISGLPPGDPPTAEPGQNIVYTLEIRNKGEEAMHDVEVVIPIPYSASYISSSATFESFTGFPSGNLAPIFDAGAGATGSIIWHIDYLPLPADPDDLLATLTYTLKVTEDCIVLTNANCEVSVIVDGTISGHGDISNIEVNDVPFIQGYEYEGNCIGEPIYDPVTILIDGTEYVNENCQGTPEIQDFTFCNSGSTIPITEVSGNFPAGCTFYDDYPPDENTEEFDISNPFPATPGTTTYYAVPPGITDCYYEFTITVTVITTSPTPTNPVYCQDDVAVPLTATPTDPSYILYYYTVASGGSAQLSITPLTDTPGNTSYWVAEGESATCVGPRVELVVTVNPAPACSITGDAGIICPLGQRTFTAPGGMSTYSWSISGNGTINGSTTTQSVDVTAGSNCDQTFTLELTVTNSFTCSSTCSIEVSVDDNNAPEFADCPSEAIDLGCNPDAVDQAKAIDDAGNVTDECDGTLTVTATAGGTTGDCFKTQSWDVVAVDDCGNTATCTVTYNWKVDTDAPEFTGVPAGSNLGCNPTEPVCSDFSVTANDACDGPVSVTCTAGEISDQGTCGKSQTFYFYAVDLCDNGKTETATFTWKVDTDAPEFTGVPAGSNLGCNPTEPVCSDFSVTANDACDGPVSVTCTAGEISDQGTCGKSQTFYFYAVDLCDNGKTETATFTWKVDTDAPEFTGVPAGSNLGCNPTEPVCSDFSVTANDACDGPVSVTCTAGEISDQGTCGKSQTFYFYAVDLCDNGKTETATFTWKVDTDAPEFTGVPAGSNLGCNPTEPVCSDFSVTANDACDGPVSVTCTAGEISDQGTCGKSQTFYFYAVDLCDNGKTETATFTWKVDTDAPDFTGVPTGSDLGCNPTEPVCSDFSVTANDNCDGPVSVTCSASAVTDQGTCGKSKTFYFYAVDLCDNGKTETATYTWKEDLTAPEFTGVPAGGDLGCNPTEPVCSDYAVTANDNCDGPVSVTCSASAVTDQGTCGKSKTFYFYAVDLCDNGKTETATYTWKEDLTAPEFTGVPAGGDLGCNPTEPQCSDFSVTANDNCDGPVSVTCSASVVTDQGTCGKSKTFYFYAVDLCDNGKTETATYTWKEDLTAPEFTGVPTGGDLGCNPTEPVCSDYAVTANDNCDGPVSVTCSASAVTDQGTCGKSKTFYFYAVDLCDNGKTETATFTWKVDDTDAPEFTGVPAGSNLGCNPTEPVCSDFSVTANDACDGPVSVTCTAGEISDQGTCGKSQTFYFYAVDLCDNGKTETATFTWKVDTDAPEFTGVPAGSNLGCNPTEPVCSDFSVTANDACDGPVSVTCTAGEISDQGTCGKSQTFYFYAVDLCDNGKTETATFTWKVDTDAPEFTGVPAGSNLGCNPTEPVCSDFSVTANDACDGPVSVTCTAGEISDQGTCGKSQTFYFYAVDLCDNGKTETATFTWKVDDTDAPEFTGVPAGSNLGCNPTEPVCSDFSVTANDACDGPVSVTCTAGEISDQGTCGKSQTFYFYAVDLCDNGKTETATFTWKVDTDAPEFTGVPAGNNLGCNPTEPVCSDFSVTANDACDGPVSVTCTAGEISDQGTCGKSQTFYFYAVDLCDNGKTETATFTWKVDTDAPEFTGVPAGSNLGCNPDEPVCSDFSVTANDACDGPVSVTCTAGEISDQGTCGKSQTFYFYAVDLCDNGKTETATFTWKVDTDAPEFTGVPAGSNLGCNPTEPVCSDFSVTANDACDGPVSVTCTAGEISDQGTCGKSQTFYFYAVDLCDNGKTETATFTWKVDTDAPEFTGVPAGSNLGCNPTEPVCSDFSVTANDACDGPVSVTCTAGEISDQGTCGKSQTFYFYAVDLCDNGKTETATFTWKVDTDAPEFTGVPAGSNLGCNPTEPVCSDFSVTANDACDGPVSVTCTAGEISDQGTCGKSQTFYFYAVDLCDNGKTETATFTWKVDTDAPEFTGVPAGSNLGCNPR